MQGRTAVIVGQVASESDGELIERLLSLEPGIDAVENELVYSTAPELVPAPATFDSREVVPQPPQAPYPLPSARTSSARSSDPFHQSVPLGTVPSTQLKGSYQLTPRGEWRRGHTRNGSARRRVLPTLRAIRRPLPSAKSQYHLRYPVGRVSLVYSSNDLLRPSGRLFSLRHCLSKKAAG